MTNLRDALIQGTFDQCRAGIVLKSPPLSCQLRCGIHFHQHYITQRYYILTHKKKNLLVNISLKVLRILLVKKIIPHLLQSDC